MILTVRRYGNKGSRYERFEVRSTPGMTVLDALFQARDEQDDSLAFRYSCRGAVCGSCAMLINGVPRLACKTQVSSLLAKEPGPKLARFLKDDSAVMYDGSKEVMVEPLPNMPVLKDLIVDMTEFFSKYQRLNPWLIPREPEPSREYPMTLAAVRELERFTNCILCGACYGACPVNGENAGYIGPAALAKLYRFRIDPRDALGGSRLKKADAPEGWWACRFYANCYHVCPRSVPPNYAIGKARKELRSEKEAGE
ncbi:MAG TPA: succinate dehydrogenase/fumarate reductase iron-sulfur subunit [Methanomassiliicoccales archaeon]|nr:succinate dehydrogenase/fumarate reductase iron-sulfur subunit [Methanomassiliicoccales archaeon]